MNMDSNQISTKPLVVKLDHIPANILDNDLNQFGSMFGEVINVKRLTKINGCATIQFEGTCFIDNDFYNCFYDTPFTPGININECFQNGKFLTDLLNILIDTRNGDDRSSRSVNENNNNNRTIKNTNTKHKFNADIYFECTYCYALANFLCERCQSPYCSIKCQRLDWLTHKKICRPKLSIQRERVLMPKK